MDKNKVLGKALYLEFRKEQYTVQLVLTPEAVNENGEYVPMRLMRRQISAYHPRKTWRFDTAGSGVINERKDALLNFDSTFAFPLIAQLAMSVSRRYFIRRPSNLELTFE